MTYLRRQSGTTAPVAPPPAEAPDTLPALLDAQALRTPEAIAVIGEAGLLSYAALHARANQFARTLAGHDIGPEDVVAVALPRSVELIVALLGTLKAGAVYLPLDVEDPAQRLGAQLADSRARCLVTTAACAAAMAADAAGSALLVLRPDDPGLQRRLAALPGDALRDSERTAPLRPAHLASLIYTSGSTGTPKGVGNTHAGIGNYLRWKQHAFPLHLGDRLLHKAVCTFDAAFGEVLYPLLSGATLVIARPGGHKDPTYLRDLIEARHVTVAMFVPSMLAAFLDVIEPGRCGTLRLVKCGGETLSAALQRRCLTLLPAALWNLYGPTEAAIACSAWRCRPEQPELPPPIGLPAANTQFHVLDAALAPVPVGAVGELHIAGIPLARGYAGRPGLTAERFIACPFGPPGARMYRTGDLVRQRADGAIEFVGRDDQQIKLCGVRIELGEIEAALLAQDGVAQAAVALRRVADQDRLVAYLVGQPGRPVPSVAALRTALAARLGAPMRPSAYITLDALPLTASGKLDRQALPDPAIRAATASEAESLERRLLALWTDIIGIDGGTEGPLLPHDDVFLRGASSLDALRAVAAMQSRLDIAFPVAQVFLHPSVAAQAAWITANAAPDARAGHLIHGSRCTLEHIRAARDPGRRRGTLLCMPLLGGSCDMAGVVAAAILPDHEIWACTFDLQGQEAPTSESWIDCAAELAGLLRRPDTGVRPDAVLGFSLGGYLGWLLDRLLSAAGGAGVPIINLDGGAVPLQRPALAERLAPLLPDGAPPPRMLLLHRETLGAMTSPARYDADWIALGADVTARPCRTIRHLDFIGAPFLAAHAGLIEAYLAGDDPPSPNAATVPTAGGRLFDWLEDIPNSDVVRAFLAMLPPGPIDPELDLALLFIAAAAGDAALALEICDRVRAGRPDSRDAHYLGVALLADLGRRDEAAALAAAWCRGREDDPVLRKRAEGRRRGDLAWSGRLGLYLSGPALEQALDIAAACCATG